jgi:hypothetical protein
MDTDLIAMNMTRVLVASALVGLLIAGYVTADLPRFHEALSSQKAFTDKAYVVAGGSGAFKGLVTGGAVQQVKANTSVKTKLQQPDTAQFANRTAPLSVRIGTGTGGVKVFSKSFSYKGFP